MDVESNSILVTRKLLPLPKSFLLKEQWSSHEIHPMGFQLVRHGHMLAGQLAPGFEYRHREQQNILSIFYSLIVPRGLDWVIFHQKWASNKN